MTDRLALVRPVMDVIQGPARRRRQRRERAQLIQVLSQIIQRGDLVFDVGAHHGDMTELFLEFGARVIAVEPQPDFAMQLKDRFADNSVTVIDKGVADSSGVRRISISAESTLSTMEPEWRSATVQSGRFGAVTWDSELSVEVTTLDELIEAFGVPSFIKIDVEGFEERVLDGLSCSVRTVSFEFVAERPSATTACVNRLRMLGMTEFNFSDGLVGPALVKSQWLPAEELLSCIQALGSPLAMGDVYARVPQVG